MAEINLINNESKPAGFFAYFSCCFFGNRKAAALSEIEMVPALTLTTPTRMSA
jgi:hypothetical protein